MKKQLIKDYLNAFTTPGGQRVLADLSRRCYEFKSTFVDHNPTGTAYKNGARDVILDIRATLISDPNKDEQIQAKE